MFGEYVITSVLYLATKQLFEVREYFEQLSENQGELFHSIVAKLLFIMKIPRTELETAVSLLMTRVSNSNIDD